MKQFIDKTSSFIWVSALVDVTCNCCIKIPDNCGIVESITYDVLKGNGELITLLAQIMSQSKCFKYFELKFNGNDNPKQVTVHWINPL